MSGDMRLVYDFCRHGRIWEFHSNTGPRLNLRLDIPAGGAADGILTPEQAAELGARLVAWGTRHLGSADRFDGFAYGPPMASEPGA